MLLNSEIGQKKIGSNNIDSYPSLELDELKRHFPKRVLYFLDRILENVGKLTGQNAKRVSRFVLLRVYQGLLNDKDKSPSSVVVKQRIIVELERTLSGLSDSFEACRFWINSTTEAFGS